MRLVALAQAGKPPTRDALEASIGLVLPLPRIEGFAPPAANIAGSPWVISAGDRVKYDAIFASEDSDHDGFISGPQAVVLFSKSGLEKDKLRHIWMLSDMDKDAKLDREEFYIAMHLVVGASKRGLPVPDAVPEALIPSSKRHLVPTGITSTVVPAAGHMLATGSNPGMVAAAQTRPTSGSMSLADALDAHMHIPVLDPVDEANHTKMLPPLAAPTAPALPVGSSGQESVGSTVPVGAAAPPFRSPVGITSASNLSDLSQSFRSEVVGQAPPVDIVATAKDLESAMQSHLKRENTLLNDRRALNDSVAAELKFLEMERQVFLKQLDSVKAQISEEDGEHRRITTALQAVRAEVTRLKDHIRQEHNVCQSFSLRGTSFRSRTDYVLQGGETVRQQKNAAGASLSALVASFVAAGGNVGCLESNIQATVQALLGEFPMLQRKQRFS
jgi:hypothetical protein